MTTIAERVAKGAAFLDEREPGWAEHVDPERLDLKSPCRCVLGQLVTELAPEIASKDNWRETCRRFGVSPWQPDDDEPTDAELGFNVPDYPGVDEDEEDEEYADLTAEWRRVIETRRAS